MKKWLSFILTSLCAILWISCHSPKSNETKTLSEVVEKNEINHNEMTDISLGHIMGKFDPEIHSDFDTIPREYADRAGMFLHKEALQSFVRMYEAAESEGINLQIRSATRNFDYQKGIWERKWTGKTILSDGINAARDINNDKDRALKILEYSSMPGTSRHHWGTDIDLNSFDNTWFETGEGLKLYNWMQANALTYGFCQPYSPKGPERPDGYEEEKWHWSYLPLSTLYTAKAEKELKDHMINGFLGSSTAEEIGVVEKYVLGINNNCKEWH